LGLPGDTLTKWKSNYWKLLEKGMHENIMMYVSQLLENSEMNQTQRQIYGMKTATISDYFSASAQLKASTDIQENLDVVIETSSMPHQDWIDCYVFHWFLNTFHQGGLTEFYSCFVRRQLDISYQEFYDDFYQWISTDQWIQTQIKEFRTFLQEWVDKGKIDHESLTGLSLSWITLQKIHGNTDQKKHVLDLCDKFMSRYHIDQDVFDDLKKLQHLRVVDMQTRASYPVQEWFNFNLYDYIIGVSDLQKQKNLLKFDFPERATMSDHEFLEQLYFGRQRRFGKTWVSTLS
jgi:hypothetical protein